MQNLLFTLRRWIAASGYYALCATPIDRYTKAHLSYNSRIVENSCRIRGEKNLCEYSGRRMPQCLGQSRAL